MSKPSIPFPLVLVLLAGALLLPIAICVTLGVGALLAALGDVAGGHLLGRTALAGGILWAIDLVCLIIILAINSLGCNNATLEE